MKSFTANIMGLSECNQNIDFIIFKVFKKLSTFIFKNEFLRKIDSLKL